MYAIRSYYEPGGGQRPLPVLPVGQRTLLDLAEGAVLDLIHREADAFGIALGVELDLAHGGVDVGVAQGLADLGVVGAAGDLNGLQQGQGSGA